MSKTKSKKSSKQRSSAQRSGTKREGAKRPSRVSREARGVTCALFIQMDPATRRALDRVAKKLGVSRASAIRGMIQAADKKGKKAAVAASGGTKKAKAAPKKTAKPRAARAPKNVKATPAPADVQAAEAVA